MEKRVDGGYGWVAVAAAFVAHFVGFGFIYSFTVFFPSILDEFGQGRGQTAWIASIAAGLLLGAGGITGRLSDRFGPAPVVVAGGVLIGSGLLVSSFATAIWQVYVSYGVILGIGVSCAFVPSIGTVGQWFERRRGLALGIAVAGTGVGSLVFAPLSSRLIASMEWRSAMRILAVIGVVLVAGAGSMLRARFAVSRRGGVLALARGNRVFALLFFSSLIASYGYWVPFVHIVPYATDRGIDARSAAGIVALMGIANTAGRVVMGALADRIGRFPMMLTSSVAMTASMFAWLLADTWAGLAGFGIAYGIFAGAFIALLPALAGDYFGVERLAGVTGLLFSGAAVGTLFGPPVTGMLFDALGSYDVAIVIAGLTMAVGTMLLFAMHDPRRAAVPVTTS